MEKYEGGNLGTNLEDESKFYIKKDIVEVRNALDELTDVWGTKKIMNDTYYFHRNMSKKDTLRIREVNNNYTPTLKIFMKKVNKRVELETLPEISQALEIRFNNIGDIDSLCDRKLKISQERYIANYEGVEYAIDLVKYYDNENKEYYSTKIFEAELKSPKGEITRLGIIQKLKDQNLLGKPCKKSKYHIGLKHLKN